MSEEHGGRSGAPHDSSEPRGLDPEELAAALQRSVAAIGADGPPRAGLARIRRRAKARQRRRTVMASSAGVLMLAVVVGSVTGSRFDIVPVLTGVVGLGGDSTSGAPTATPHAGSSGQVRTVRPPAAVAGKKGPAIGPVTASATPSALASAGVPQCTAADLTAKATVDAVINGVSYGHVDAVASATCAVAGPPVLQVENLAGTAVRSVVILEHESTDGSQLPDVATWGAVLKLQAGQGFTLQYAWAPDECSAAVATGSATASGSASPSLSAAASQSPESTYSLSYLVSGTSPTLPADLQAACGATVYVTDIYRPGAYALPVATASPTPQASTSSAPAPTQAPTTLSPASSSPTTAPTSAAATSSGTSTSSSSATTGSATQGAANATAIPSSTS
ncbi:hypothetical protein KDK95_07325 [Actinospica sp. MGRD01-02]|uniref:Uncharacterized protein n=1 Tax=Actinospica acidithermotolerans TaxID=2828514 RepID=A0A941IIF9_9ACTN|nr:hypothetical protein [Actinospica acidithermotolerans]MBR7826108.1 hypothetical protein [Actinospica acidithermotolerans]